MKKLLQVILGLTFVTSLAHAQSQKYIDPNLSEGIHPGTVITLDKQVLQGYVVNLDMGRNQKKCIFFTDYHDSNTRKEYKPADILGYSIENLQYKSIPYSGNIGFGKGSQQFVYVAKPGAITTFIYYAPEQQILWQKGDDEPVSNSSMLFSMKKSLTKLLGDDPDLATIIDTNGKAYLLMHLDAMIDQYNTWAQAKK